MPANDVNKAEYVRMAIAGLASFPGIADYALFLYHAGMDYPSARKWLANYSDKYYRV